MAIRHLAAGDDESRWLSAEQQRINHYLRYGNRELVGKSDTNYAMQERIRKVAVKDCARVIIFGESGTGKETIMQLIHNHSPRKDEPLIAFNCTTVNPALLESRLFGYDKGGFTGAVNDTPGLFEQTCCLQPPRRHLAESLPLPWEHLLFQFRHLVRICG